MQGRRHCLAATLGEVMQTCPADVEQEKAVLIMTMLLARKVADHTPRLFRVVYDTVVDFINQNLLTYVRDLVRNVSTRDATPLPCHEVPSGPHGSLCGAETHQCSLLQPVLALCLSDHKEGCWEDTASCTFMRTQQKVAEGPGLSFPCITNVTAIQILKTHLY